MSYTDKQIGDAYKDALVRAHILRPREGDEYKAILIIRWLIERKATPVDLAVDTVQVVVGLSLLQTDEIRKEAHRRYPEAA